MYKHVNDTRNDYNRDSDREVLMLNIATALFKQGEAAVDCNGSCRYRTQRGEKILACAIGVLIPDEKYSEHMEGSVPPANDEDIQFELDRDTEFSMTQKLLTAAGINMYDAPFVRAIQRLHDKYKDVSHFIEFNPYIFGGLMALAGDYGLGQYKLADVYADSINQTNQSEG